MILTSSGEAIVVREVLNKFGYCSVMPMYTAECWEKDVLSSAPVIELKQNRI